MSRSIDVRMTRLQMPILIVSRSSKKCQVGRVDRDWLMVIIFYTAIIWGDGAGGVGSVAADASAGADHPRHLDGYAARAQLQFDHGAMHRPRRPPSIHGPGDPVLPIESFCRPSTLCRRWVGPEIHEIPEIVQSPPAQLSQDVPARTPRMALYDDGQSSAPARVRRAAASPPTARPTRAPERCGDVGCTHRAPSRRVTSHSRRSSTRMTRRAPILTNFRRASRISSYKIERDTPADRAAWRTEMARASPQPSIGTVGVAMVSSAGPR
jgi:hypothetical protein